MLLTDKHAVIYGAAGAIGGAVARTFAREGAEVFLTGRTPAKLDAVAKEITAEGGRAHTAVVDALDPRAVEEHAATMPRIDVSFNAIGFHHGELGVPLVDITPEAFAVAVSGYTRTNFVTATAAARRMTGQRSGVILTLSSSASRMPAAMSGGFGTACTAVEGLTQQLAAELGPHGIRVICLRPAGILESVHHGSHARRFWAGAAERMGITLEQMLAAPAPPEVLLGRAPLLAEVAEVAAFMASDRASAMTSTVANVSCGAVGD
jgi:NAD(P)-dependent dehydrogenase (short-subunit alcohol dehydrogenase family)